MTVTPTPDISPLSTTPNRNMGPAGYVTAANTWMAELPGFGDSVKAIGDAAEANADAAEDAAAAAELSKTGAEVAQAAALLATQYVGESTSSMTVAAGAKTVHLTSAKTGFANGRLVALVYRGDPDVRLYGTVSGWDGADDMTVTVASDGVVGSGGPYADWLVMDAAFIPLGATGQEVRALLSAVVFMTPKSIADALTFVDGGTGSGTYTPDHAAGMNHKRIANGNSTLAALANPREGEAFYIRLTQDATGSRTWSFNSGYKFVEGRKTPSTAANAVDAVSGVVITASPFLADCTLVRNFS